MLLLFFGVLVLFYLAYGAIRDFFKMEDIMLSQKGKGKNHFLSGIVLTISNPAVLLLWTGILGADLASRSNALEAGLLLGFGILIGVIIFFTVLTFLIHKGRRFIHKGNFKYISLIAGLILLYFALTFGYRLILLFL